MLTLSQSTESEKSIDLMLWIDRYSLLFIFVVECRNSFFFLGIDYRIILYFFIIDFQPCSQRRKNQENRLRYGRR